MRGEAKEYFAVENTSCTMLPMKKRRKEPSLGIDSRGWVASATSWFGVGNVLLATTNWYGAAPDLGGYEDHASSIGGGIGFGMATAYIAARLMTSRYPEMPASRVKSMACAAAGVLAVGASMFIETKTGLELLDKKGVGEPIDFAVGVGSAVTAGALGIEVFEFEQEPKPPTPELES